ncbi:hypothetical protein B0H66DRAFT_389629 [Apodospora peruviana]|uniref:Uncharacterized protein n=1 Tax=Apodospora peruviana TaxID=516989 RepID=A0AAE0LY02_9PEZI|nr:hypothetical protein B0H66DRAFT_389629 [Apodospora peruviana]
MDQLQLRSKPSLLLGAVRPAICKHHRHLCAAKPEVSALVWASIKLTLQIIVNFVSYFDAFSKMFIRFDSMRPRFEEYSLLFPTSARLKKALIEFQGSIIRCCNETILTSRRTWHHQVIHILFSSFENDMAPFVQ